MKKKSEDSAPQEPPQEPSQKISFEEALEELETLVGTLEDGKVPLETSLLLVQRGLGLIERCEGELARAEFVLEQLMATPDGELRTQRIGGEDDEDDEF